MSNWSKVVDPILGRERYRVLHVAYLLISLPLFFSIVRYVPDLKFSLDIAIVLSVLAALLCNTGTKSRMRSGLNFYMMLCVVFIPALGTITAYLVFGQPPVYGLITQRGLLLILFAFAIGQMIYSGRLTIFELQRALIPLAWLNLVFCTLVLLLFDPNNYRDLGSLVIDGGGIFNKFNLPTQFILFGAMYYISKWFFHNRTYDGVCSIIFILYIAIGNGGRILTLSLLISVVVVFLFARPASRFLTILLASALITVLSIFLAAYYSSYVDSLSTKYQDAVGALLGATDVSDISANARIIQSAIAWPLIYDNPLFGNGAISNQWNEGYTTLFGYFHPADLGLVGLTFVYGIVGLIFFSIQYVMFIVVWRNIKSVALESPLLLAFVATLFLLLVTSLLTGLFLINPEQPLFYFSILIGIHRRLAAVARFKSQRRVRRAET